MSMFNNTEQPETHQPPTKKPPIDEIKTTITKSDLADNAKISFIKEFEGYYNNIQTYGDSYRNTDSIRGAFNRLIDQTAKSYEFSKSRKEKLKNILNEYAKDANNIDTNLLALCTNLINEITKSKEQIAKEKQDAKNAKKEAKEAEKQAKAEEKKATKEAKTSGTIKQINETVDNSKLDRSMKKHFKSTFLNFYLTLTKAQKDNSALTVDQMKTDLSKLWTDLDSKYTFNTEKLNSILNNDTYINQNLGTTHANLTETCRILINNFETQIETAKETAKKAKETKKAETKEKTKKNKEIEKGYKKEAKKLGIKYIPQDTMTHLTNLSNTQLIGSTNSYDKSIGYNLFDKEGKFQQNAYKHLKKIIELLALVKNTYNGDFFNAIDLNKLLVSFKNIKGKHFDPDNSAIKTFIKEAKSFSKKVKFKYGSIKTGIMLDKLKPINRLLRAYPIFKASRVILFNSFDIIIKGNLDTALTLK